MSRTGRLSIGLLAAFGLVVGPRAATAQPSTALQAGTITDKVACATDPTQTYSLYLPKAYTRDRSWPLLLVFDPRGRGRTAAEVFREGAEEFGWVVASSDNTRSDTGWEPNGKALQAMWPDLPVRVNVDRRRIYAAGFSGTVYVAWRLGQVTRQLAGILGTGGGLPREAEPSNGAPLFFAAAGLHDFNYLTVKSLVDALVRRGVGLRLEFFEGGHDWFPPGMARDAIAWLEIQAMRGGARARDEAMIDRVLALERARAESLERAGRLLEALDAFQATSDSFQGLADVGFAVERVKQLEASDRLKEARREEKRWNEWEDRARPDLGRGLTRLLTEDPTATRQAANDIGLTSVRSHATRIGPEGQAANRLLGWAFAQASFYLWRDMMERKQWSRAIASQRLALEIDPDAPVAWYRLAASQARAGQRKQALDSLERAIAGGFRAVDALVGNADFEAIKEDPTFRQLVERARTKS